MLIAIGAVSVSLIQVGPLGCFMPISITTPVVSALKKYICYIAVYVQRAF